MTSEPDDIEAEDTEGVWKCPITGHCSHRKIHRPCTQMRGDDPTRESSCAGFHAGKACWDCCSNCQTECAEPAMNTIDYDMPE